MDKRGVIHQHSKIKLELYRLYLERYLSILLLTPFFTSIEILDLFAGSGISENEQKGSAVIAAETIASVQKKNNIHNKTVTLRLNDSNSKNKEALEKNLAAYEFKSVTSVAANSFVQSWRPKPNTHNLFFLDPHGYSQLSLENLKRIFTTARCDFLIFIPIFHIYRFLHPDLAKSEKDSVLPGLGTKQRTVENDKYYEPIINFLNGLGIGQTDAQSANSVEEFAEMIVAALRKISGSDYVFTEILENAERNSKYALFFISHHILGAEKFLEAQHDLKAKLETASGQHSFEFAPQPDHHTLLDQIEYDFTYDNVSLYQLGIRCGLKSSETSKQVKELEKRQKVEVKALPGKQRNQGGLYINFDHYKKGDKKIAIIFKR